MRTHVFVVLAVVFVSLSSCRKGQNPATSQDGGTVNKTENNASESGNTEVVDFTMASMDGTELSVSKLAAQHKLTVIDFWASWCGPCRQEIPRLVQLYKAYKDKGLGIIGVSLDEERGAWEAAVSSMDMQWTQLSDLQGWDNAAAVKYGVHGIPYTIIVDSECNVVAKGLRGDRLARLVEEKLGK